MQSSAHCVAVGAQPRELHLYQLTDQERISIVDLIGYCAVKVENNHIVGVVINRPGSLLEALGIVKGDVVTMLNGESLANPNGIERLAVVLARMPAFELVVRSSNGDTRTVRCASRQNNCRGP